jgi:hypothetical protein
MNAPVGGAGSHASSPQPVLATTMAAAPAMVTHRRNRAGCKLLRTRVAPRHVIVTLALLLYPFVAPPFFTYQMVHRHSASD